MKFYRSIVVSLLALVLSVALTSCGSDAKTKSPSAAGPKTIEVTVVGDKITPAPAKIGVAKDTEVTIHVTADKADEVHVHGYDKHIELEPNAMGMLTFTADIPGDFEVELEGSATLLFTLEVK